MLHRILLLLGVILIWSPSAYATGLSAPTNGVYLAVGAWPQPASGSGTNQPIRFDETLIFLTFCNTGQVELKYPLDPAYGVKVRMTDAAGKDVSATSLGKRFGSKFDSLRTITDTRVYPIVAWGSYQDNPGLGGARFLCDRHKGAIGAPTGLAPKDLFEMTKPGVYTLEIQLKMFRFDPKSTNAWNYEPFCFSPLTIKAEKPGEGRP
jgi:hypothetical protein